MKNSLKAHCARQNFVVTTQADELERLASYGTCLVGEITAMAIELHITSRQNCLQAGRTLDILVAQTPDRIVWRNHRIVAMLRPLADGTLAVIRFPESGYPVALDASEIGGAK